MNYRITPTLGPDIGQHAEKHYWELNSSRPSYSLGTMVKGSDGHDYVYVEAANDLAKDAAIQIDEKTFVAKSASGSYFFKAPVAVKAGEKFHARRNSL